MSKAQIVATGLSREAMPDAPDGDWFDIIVKKMRELADGHNLAMSNGITLADNMASQIVSVDVNIPPEQSQPTLSGSGTAGSVTKWVDGDTIGDASASEVLAVVKTVDGTGSGLDADLLDGVQGSDYAPKASPDFTGDVTATGNLRVGDATAPLYPIDIKGAMGNTRIAVYNSGTSVYGFGIQSSQFRLHLGNSAAKFSFLDAPAGTEIMTLAGNGDLTITRRLLAGAVTGMATIASNGTSITVSNSLVTASSRVIVTPTANDPDGAWWVTQTTGSFVIHRSPASVVSAKFNYLIVEG